MHPVILSLLRDRDVQVSVYGVRVHSDDFEGEEFIAVCYSGTTRRRYHRFLVYPSRCVPNRTNLFYEDLCAMVTRKIGIKKEGIKAGRSFKI